MATDVNIYQDRVADYLKDIFGEHNVKKEWNAAKNSRDDFTRRLYSPRLDIAVGPFNIDGNVEANNRATEEAVHINRRLLYKLWRKSEQRDISFSHFMQSKNKNPRCFLAIEIENSGSSKHMLGNIANTSIMGAIGIVVPFNNKKLLLCKRLKGYIKFATTVRKIESVFQNVLIIKKDTFEAFLQE